GRRCRKATAPTEPAGETHTDVCQDFLCNMTAEDTVQMDGVRFLEVPLRVSNAFSFLQPAPAFLVPLSGFRQPPM
ncbi:MAG: hypothetical protein VZR27_12975, partial [Acutalibacteraceae bacterium]|nr:hypothetical protein [Acutalibacteraceae bacterium]